MRTRSQKKAKNSSQQVPAHIPISQRTWKRKVVDNTVGLAMGPPLLPFQNLDKKLNTLDNFNKFYRVACNPIHQLYSEKFFRDLDKIYQKDNEGESGAIQKQKVAKQTLKTADQATEQIALQSIVEYYDQKQAGIIDFVTFSAKVKLSDKFIQLLKTDGIFYTSQTKGNIIIEHVTSKSNSNSTMSPTYNEPLRLTSRELLDVNHISQRNVLDTQIGVPPLTSKYMHDEYILEEGSSNELLDSPSFRNRFLEQDDLDQANQHIIDARATLLSKKKKKVQLIDRGAILTQLNIAIPDSAVSRQFLLSTPDSYYTYKGSLIPRATQTQKNLNEQKDTIFLDMFALKILGLIACRDKIDVKEALFVDLVRDGDLFINIESVRLKRAVKKLIYFSEIMPRKYFCEMLYDPSQRRSTLHSNTNTSSKKTAKSSTVTQKEEDSSWTREYVSEIESFFHNNFDSIYATDFVPILFPKNQKELNRKDFLKNLARINLMVDPLKLSYIFQQDLEDFRFQQHKMEKAINFFTY